MMWKSPIKESLPLKNTDDDPKYETDYTKALLKVVSDNQTLVHVSKVRERLNMLKETLSDIKDHNKTTMLVPQMKMHGLATKARRSRSLDTRHTSS
jgi:hypothetical protein